MVANNQLHTETARMPFAVASAGGGQAQQFRVQYHPPQNNTWRMYACFRQEDQAQQCVEELETQGYTVRCIQFAALPTAA